jgi:hypothetical protein
MIRKVADFKDEGINTQINEIVSSQFANYKEIDVTFTAASTDTRAEIGFWADRFFIVDKSADIRVWRVSSDKQNMILQASGAGTVTLKVWKGV